MPPPSRVYKQEGGDYDSHQAKNEQFDATVNVLIEFRRRRPRPARAARRAG